jgi:hypothetical protein
MSTARRLRRVTSVHQQSHLATNHLFQPECSGCCEDVANRFVPSWESETSLWLRLGERLRGSSSARLPVIEDCSGGCDCGGGDGGSGAGCGASVNVNTGRNAASSWAFFVVMLLLIHPPSSATTHFTAATAVEARPRRQSGTDSGRPKHIWMWEHERGITLQLLQCLLLRRNSYLDRRVGKLHHLRTHRGE